MVKWKAWSRKIVESYAPSASLNGSSWATKLWGGPAACTSNWPLWLCAHSWQWTWHPRTPRDSEKNHPSAAATPGRLRDTADDHNWLWSKLPGTSAPEKEPIMDDACEGPLCIWPHLPELANKWRDLGIHGISDLMMALTLCPQRLHHKELLPILPHLEIQRVVTATREVILFWQFGRNEFVAESKQRIHSLPHPAGKKENVVVTCGNCIWWPALDFKALEAAVTKPFRSTCKFPRSLKAKSHASNNSSAYLDAYKWTTNWKCSLDHHTLWELK